MATGVGTTKWTTFDVSLCTLLQASPDAIYRFPVLLPMEQILPEVWKKFTIDVLHLENNCYLLSLSSLMMILSISKVNIVKISELKPFIHCPFSSPVVLKFQHPLFMCQKILEKLDEG